MGRALVAFACCTCAFALNPDLDVSQYAHKSWTVREGFFKSGIRAITQTPDGYLWLGSEFGLLRFDGVKSVAWEPPPGQHLPSSFIRGILAARDGTLWIGTLKGLASWKGGKLTQYQELAGYDVFRVIEDRQGSVWAGAGAPTGRLCEIKTGSVQCHGEDGSLGPGVWGLYEDSKGSLWAGVENGLWRWRPGPPRFYPLPGEFDSVQGFAEGDDGALLFAARTGVRQVLQGRIESYLLPDNVRVNARKLLRDREASLWIATSDRALVHVHQGRTDFFALSDGLSGEFVNSFLEDREGNLWVTTSGGLDRFCDVAASPFSVGQGLSSTPILPLLADGNGSIWFNTTSGLNRWNHGQFTVYQRRNSPLPTGAAHKVVARALPDSVSSVYQDERGRIWVATAGGFGYLEDDRFIPMNSVPARIVYSFTQDTAGNLWISEYNRGLLRLSPENAIQQIAWATLGTNGVASTLAADRVQGGLWLGFLQGGAAYLKDGRIRASYGAREGLGEGRVNDMRTDRDGTLWASTEGGLSRLKDGHISTLSGKNGLPCDTVHWSLEDAGRTSWLYMPCGLVRIARPELDAWATDPKRTIKATVFDISDGVSISAGMGPFSPRAAKSPDGKLWFVYPGGASVVDPGHLPFNKLPPPVYVEEVKVDGNPWDASHGWRLPALTRDLEIHYTALSLVAPEKNRFRYKLEGRDSDWKAAGNERKASYTDLPPRNYRFRVMASNNNGVWNETGDTLEFSIAPAYYQTTWFKAACVAAFFVLLWGLYRYRLYQVARELNANLEGRFDERLRVARDLHDTLLQSFHGLLPRLQAAVNLLPGRASDARQVLEAAVDDAAHAITEARDAVQDMRSSATTENDLAKAVEVMGQELAAHRRDAAGDAPAFSLEVEGASQDLHPILRDEIYRIASEALRNAFHHAQARGIEVEIRYDPRQLRVRLRDDGIGIDADVLRQEGREGHFGFRGMRERAKGIGGRLEIWSERGAGTEVELIVPASVAYAGHAGRRSWLFRRKVRTNS